MADAPQLDLEKLLAPARLRLGLARVERWAVRGLAGGAVCGVLILLSARYWPYAAAPVVALVLLCLGGAAGVGWGARHWPDTHETARAVDRHFVLHDRVATAVETGTSQRPVVMLLRADVVRRVHGLKIAESGRLPRSARDIGAASAAVILLGGLLLVGAPARSIASLSAASDARNVKRAATVTMPQLVHTIGQNAAPRLRQNPALRRLNLALARLQRQLAHASTRAGALRAISATQQQIHQIAQSLHPVKPVALSQLSHALASRMTASQRAGAASGRSNRALAAAAQTLNSLARSLARLTPAQRAALAKSLARAANATSDSRLRAALHQAASSLAYNDPQSAAQALKQASSGLEQSPNAQAIQGQANTANSRLDSLKSDISGMQTSGNSLGVAAAQIPSAGQRPGKAGRGTGSGTGTGKQNGGATGRGAGAGQGKGSGQRQGNGRGQGQGQGTRSGVGSGGQGGTGGHGAGGGRGGTGSLGRGHPGASVYIPGKAGNGAHSIQNGPNGAPLPGSSVPYQQVVGRYAQSAHTALDRASLPSDLQTYVRGYFSAISK